MQKLVLLSVLFATIIIPMQVSKEKNPVLGLKKAIVYMFFFNIVYMMLLLFVFPRLQ
jgi:hypothetical protein